MVDTTESAPIESPEAPAPAPVQAPLKRPVRPDSNAHKKRLAEIDVQIDALTSEEKSLSDAFKAKVEARRSKTTGPDASFARFKELRDKKKQIHLQLDALNEEKETVRSQLGTKSMEAKSLSKSIPFKTIEELDAKIYELDLDQQTTNLGISEEKRILKEISHLQEIKRTFPRIHSTMEETTSLKGKLDVVHKRITELRAELDKIKVEIAPLQEEYNSRSADREAKKEDTAAEWNAFKGGKAELKKQIRELVQQKKAMKTEFQENMKKYHDEMDAYFAAFEAEEKKAEEEYKKAEDEKKKALEAEEAAKHPYQEQLDICDSLLVQFKGLFPSIYSKVTEPRTEKKKEEVKPEDEEEDVIVREDWSAKKKPSSTKPAKTRHDKLFNLPVEVVIACSSVYIRAPKQVSEVEATIRLIIERRAVYERSPRDSEFDFVPKAVQVAVKPKKVSEDYPVLKDSSKSSRGESRWVRRDSSDE